MSKSGALDLATGVGGKIKKEDVQSAVDQYEKYHVSYGGDEETRKANYSDMVNKYYDLATSFYEFGWGESFHFAPRCWMWDVELVGLYERLLDSGYPVDRNELNHIAGLSESCNFVKVKTLEFMGIAPAGSNRVSSFLEKAAEGLVEGGNH
ncbi:hypothetical protein C4D60_Mb07t00120 [Musa balbisiana]|uniref:Sterol methyltransferase C-terminal domain-containing protein n=1 Tax=Musa balbisiana TaxID=52838 RepID=A0A4V4H6B2_MUSBA|nr:hypothetical protein C4D60_Mb07t00120 [Musa balbisiana]